VTISGRIKLGDPSCVAC